MQQLESDPRNNTQRREPVLLRDVVAGICSVVGAVLFFLLAFCLLVEIWTSPRLPAWRVWLSLIASGASMWRVLSAARAARAVSVRALVVFLCAVALLVFDVWTFMSDPSAKWFFTGVAVTSSTAILVTCLLAPVDENTT